MVGVAQQVELLVVVQAVAGSSPVAHPRKALLNALFSPAGRLLRPVVPIWYQFSRRRPTGCSSGQPSGPWLAPSARSRSAEVRRPRRRGRDRRTPPERSDPVVAQKQDEAGEHGDLHNDPGGRATRRRAPSQAVPGCTRGADVKRVRDEPSEKNAAVSGTRGTVSRPAATKSCAEGTGESANTPSPATALPRLPTSSSSAASRFSRRSSEKRDRKCRAVAASTSRPEAAARAPNRTSGTAGSSELRRKKTSMAQVGGPNAGRRLTPKMVPRASSQSLTDTFRTRRIGASHAGSCRLDSSGRCVAQRRVQLRVGRQLVGQIDGELHEPGLGMVDASRPQPTQQVDHVGVVAQADGEEVSTPAALARSTSSWTAVPTPLPCQASMTAMATSAD